MKYPGQAMFFKGGVYLTHISGGPRVHGTGPAPVKASSK